MTAQLTEGRAVRRPLWRDRNFALFWAGQTVGELGTRMSGVAVPLLAAGPLRATVSQASLLTVLTWLPYLLCSLPAGLLADRVLGAVGGLVTGAFAAPLSRRIGTDRVTWVSMAVPGPLAALFVLLSPLRTMRDLPAT
ncbi:hypothetical protein ABZ436_22250 [Micromonospora matsumotoense]|uniref:hypothetical protein n=1 Tax=Micromonospora matsumotoense TaxID=121616 RepID=UPI0033FD795B